MSNQEQKTKNKEHDSETLVRVEGVSKKFCKSLKRSLWYGMCDTARELNPFAQVSGSTLQVPRSDDEEISTCNLQPATCNPEAELPPLRHDEFWAVKNVSFELKRGECLGLIGHNGAGKSTLLKMLNGLIKPDSGRIEMKGRIGALIELGAGFNPILTGRENIYNKGAILGFTKKEVDQKFDEIVDFSEIGEFIDMPVQNYSSGMKVRLGFAVSAQMEPDVMIIDEVLAVGDTNFRVKSINKILQLMETTAVIFVSHGMTQVAGISTSVMYLKSGCIQTYTAEVSRGIDQYLKDQNHGLGNYISTGEIDLVECVLNPGNAENIKIPTLQRGDSLTVQLKLKNSSIKLVKFAVRIMIFNIEYRPVAEMNSKVDDFAISMDGSELSIRAVFKELYLNNGRYSIHVNIFEKDSHEVLVRAGDAAYFTCEIGTPSYADHLLSGQWSTSSEERKTCT